jgi:hypothetical protein
VSSRGSVTFTFAMSPPLTSFLAVARRALGTREAAVTAITWLCVAIAATALRGMAFMAVGARPTLANTTADLPLIAIWAAVTPLVLRSARRWPVRGPRARPHAVLHLAIGAVFIVASNVLIRLPLLWHPGDGVRVLLAGTMLGLATYAPGAMIAYGLLVVIGHRLFVAPSIVGGPAEADADAPLMVREWNRVHLVPIGDVEWIEADDNYVVVHANGRSYKERARIRDMEARLDQRFIRIHRSVIVSLPKIREVQPLVRGDHAVILRSGKVLRVSRGRREVLERALETAR